MCVFVLAIVFLVQVYPQSESFQQEDVVAGGITAIGESINGFIGTVMSVPNVITDGCVDMAVRIRDKIDEYTGAVNGESSDGGIPSPIMNYDVLVKLRNTRPKCYAAMLNLATKGPIAQSEDLLKLLQCLNDPKHRNRS